jgi:glycosyltransferase involved in cell wall biosynthesis
MDIFCFPSLSEGLPNAVMEAAAAGLPIVAWKLPFCQELLPDAAQALLVEPGNLEVMSSALSQLLNSAQLRAQYGSAARLHILENFDLARYIQNMTAVYELVLKRNKDLA